MFLWDKSGNHGHLISYPVSSHRNQDRRLIGDWTTVGGMDTPETLIRTYYSVINSTKSHDITTSLILGVVS